MVGVGQKNLGHYSKCVLAAILSWTSANLTSCHDAEPAGMQRPTLELSGAGGQDHAGYLVPITGAQQGMAPIYQDWLQAPEFSYVFDLAQGLEPYATYIVVLHFAGQNFFLASLMPTSWSSALHVRLLAHFTDA